MQKYAVEHMKTVPWLGHEYITVDGVPLVYTVDERAKIIRVLFPGGGTVSVETLRRHGRLVIVPPDHMLRRGQVVA